MSGRSKHPITKDHHAAKIDADHMMGMVQELSRVRGERMTSVRRDVILAMTRLAKPHTAYQILGDINKKRVPELSAMSLYRTLDFLIELGVVVKSDSQNTYRLCAEPAHHHSHLVIICDGCGETQDIDDLAATEKLESLARRYGHKLKHHVIELHGTCAHCGA